MTKDVPYMSAGNEGRAMNAIKLANASQIFGFDFFWSDFRYMTGNDELIHKVHLHVFGEVFVGEAHKKGVAKDVAANAFFRVHPELWPS
ncbi:uncharacterized protein EI90DRAFT_3128213 [Cantharellus anzutake]|uniref:uncharacterized protein n=1 Tax=Cantharellus anzutake TaxID=1750568 RepID=UPI001907C75C|nr:uncharacterized protein EI90DRAFT_3128213 [Cantharellus anzutake]KAF8326072.1 hypothetical protein EI90DRAFT_3128213 [Cantharellus anzutake]